MAEAALKLGAEHRETTFMDKVKELLPEQGHLNLCLTCGACSSGCPATGLEDMDPRKFLRMAALGLDEEVTTTPWVWMCTMCTRCVYACPMQIDIPKLVFYARQSWPEDKKPRGIVQSCKAAMLDQATSAMGATSEDFQEAVEETLEEVRKNQRGYQDLQVTFDRKGAKYFLNQNSREPMTEPEEMLPLWKIMHQAGADWTYGSAGWAAENYCMFAANDEQWEKIVRTKAEAVDSLGCEYWLNTE